MKKIFVGIFVAVVSTFVACDDDLKYDMDTVYDYESNFEFLWKEFDQKYSTSTIRRIRLRIGMLSMMNI